MQDNDNKNKKFAYLVLAVAAGLILNEVAPTSFIKTQFKLQQEKNESDAQYKFGLNGNINTQVASSIMAQYVPKDETIANQKIKSKITI